MRVAEAALPRVRWRRFWQAYGAQQQDVAHRINEIGVKTDQEAQTAMAAIGAATNDKMADMLEAHEGHMVFARNILEQKAKADERFARRFAAIVEKHDKNQYGA